MATDKDKKADMGNIGIPTAKRNEVLQNITKQMSSKELTTTVEIGEHSFLLSTLKAEEELWADGIFQVNSTAQAMSSYRMSRVAASIKQIDGIHVSDLFEFPDDMNKERIEQLTGTSYGRRAWEMGQVYMWLGELPMPVIDELGREYNELSKKRKESITELKKPLARTSGGTSEDTSSPEKESSQAIQM